MNGTWKVTGGGAPDIPVIPLAAAVLVVAVVSWLATILLILAVVLAVLAVALLAAFLLLSRRNPADAELLAERFAAFNAEVTAPKAAPGVTENHYHLHVERGTDLSGLAFPLRDAVTEINEIKEK